MSQELKAILPLDPPNDPVYIDIVDGHVIVPQLVFQKTIDEPKTSEDTLLSNAVPATFSTNQEPRRRRSGLEHSPRKVGRTNPSHDRPKSLKEVMAAPLPNARR